LPLPCVLAKVGLLNRQPTLGPADGDYIEADHDAQRKVVALI
jgi:hypothetical protein